MFRMAPRVILRGVSQNKGRTVEGEVGEHGGDQVDQGAEAEARVGHILHPLLGGPAENRPTTQHSQHNPSRLANPRLFTPHWFYLPGTSSLIGRRFDLKMFNVP